MQPQTRQGPHRMPWKALVVLVISFVVMASAVPNAEDPALDARAQLMYLVLQEEGFVSMLEATSSTQTADTNQDAVQAIVDALRVYSQTFLDQDRPYPFLERSLQVLGKFLATKQPTCLQLDRVTSEPSRISTRDLYAFASRVNDRNTLETICVALAEIAKGENNELVHAQPIQWLTTPNVTSTFDLRSLVNSDEVYRQVYDALATLFPGVPGLILKDSIAGFTSEASKIAAMYWKLLSNNSQVGGAGLLDNIGGLVAALRAGLSNSAASDFDRTLAELVSSLRGVAEQARDQLLVITAPPRASLSYLYPDGRMPELPNATLPSTVPREETDIFLKDVVAFSLCRVFPLVPCVVIEADVSLFSDSLQRVVELTLALLRVESASSSAETSRRSAWSHRVSQSLDDVRDALRKRIPHPVRTQDLDDAFMHIAFVTRELWRHMIDSLVAIGEPVRRAYLHDNKYVPSHSDAMDHFGPPEGVVPIALAENAQGDAHMLQEAVAALHKVLPELSKDEVMQKVHAVASDLRDAGKGLFASLVSTVKGNHQEHNENHHQEHNQNHHRENNQNHHREHNHVPNPSHSDVMDHFGPPEGVVPIGITEMAMATNGEALQENVNSAVSADQDTVALVFEEETARERTKELVTLFLENSGFLRAMENTIPQGEADADVQQIQTLLVAFTPRYMTWDRAYTDLEKSHALLAAFLHWKLPACLAQRTVTSKPLRFLTRDMYAMSSRLNDMCSVETICVALAEIAKGEERVLDIREGQPASMPPVPRDGDVMDHFGPPEGVVPIGIHEQQDEQQTTSDVAAASVSGMFPSIQRASQESLAVLNAPKLLSGTSSTLTALNVFLMVCLGVALVALAVMSVIILQRGSVDDKDATTGIYHEMKSEC